MHCTVVRGDACPLLLSPCNTIQTGLHECTRTVTQEGKADVAIDPWKDGSALTHRKRMNQPAIAAIPAQPFITPYMF